MLSVFESLLAIPFGKILLFVVTIFLISIVDFIVITRARFKKHYEVHELTKRDRDYTILIPIFGNLSYLKNVGFLHQYAKHVVLCCTTKENPEFNAQINALAKKYGFRIFRSDIPVASRGMRPNPWNLFTHTLRTTTPPDPFNKQIARDEIIRDSFVAIDTEYCIFLDGDTVARESMPKLIGLMRELDFDLASVRVLASKQDTLMEKLQSVEYELAMDARKIYPWLTSGACMVAKTQAINTIMQHHSLFFSGGDIEVGKLAGILKYKVGHLRFNFYTDVPSTFRAWFKQRLAWGGGGFRHAIVNLHRYTWRHPFFYFYSTILVYMLTPIRIYELIDHPWVLPVIIVLYWALIFTFHWKTKKWFYLLFPFYALLQILVIIPLGALMYLRMAWSTSNVGHIRLRPKKIAAA